MTRLIPITVAHGDGIGPEIMAATLRILEAAGAPIAPETIDIGEKVYLEGHSSGIKPEAWESLRRTQVFLKAPITTPQGGGYKSLNVTIRKTLGLYANIRPCVAYHPAVSTLHPGMDLVIVRENEEDLYAGIEHRQTDQVVQCLKLISQPGCEKIIRYAFEYARAHGRKKVTCMSKDNIMKLTDGLFHRVFDEVAKEYPGIHTDHSIIDIGTARLASQPERFDVIVTSNLYGDIISDVAAELTGSVGLGGSANIGDHVAMFEAIHGSAPDIAGKGIANPSGLLLGAVLMLVHIGAGEVAEKVHNAWLTTLEDGIHTGDIYREGISEAKVGTDAFADAVIARLGQKPEHFRAAHYPSGSGDRHAITLNPPARAWKALVGVDVFLDSLESPEVLGPKVAALAGEGFELQMLTNRGVKVWPGGFPETFCTDHWRARFMGKGPVTHRAVIDLLARFAEAGIDFIKTEHLCTFDGKPGYSLGQGQ